MISFGRVAKAYGATDVLEDVTFRLLSGDRLGLVGPNGAGKTTIAKLILGEEAPSSGSIVLDRGIRVGYVPQYPDIPDRTTVESYLLGSLYSLQRELRRLEIEMSNVDEAALPRVLEEYAGARDRWDRADGDRLVGTCEAVLGRLGLDGILEQEAATLSGGERNLVSLARAALPHPEVLILDEPGNHLDYRGQDLLEEFLKAYDGAVLVISHNRYLLDRVATGILELENGSVESYAGGYSAYRLGKLRTAAARQATFVAEQKKLRRLEALVSKFEEISKTHADPAWGRRLRARRTQLAKARERAVDEPTLSGARIAVNLGDSTGKADIAIDVRNYARAIGSTVLFEDASFRMSMGERVALIGPNGCGKTTFLRDLVGTGSWEHPQLRVGPSVRLAYCAQNQELLPEGLTLVDALQREFGLTAHRARDVLGRYGFGGSAFEKRIGDLSGGEKNRLQFAYAELTGANLLVLDEPTNHMDIVSREVIEDALWEFSGSILVVSHDRYLLEKIAERTVVIEDRTFVSFPGSFTEYVRSEGGFWTGRDQEPKRSLAGARSSNGNSDIEARILSLESEKRDLERRIEAAFNASNHVEGRRCANRLDRVIRRIDKLYEEWAG